MKVCGVPIPVIRTRLVRRAACARRVRGVGAALPPPPWEEEPKAPEYSLKVVEGETTVPEESILSTSGSVRVPHTANVPGHAADRPQRADRGARHREGRAGVWLSRSRRSVTSSISNRRPAPSSARSSTTGCPRWNRRSARAPRTSPASAPQTRKSKAASTRWCPPHLRGAPPGRRSADHLALRRVVRGQLPDAPGARGDGPRGRAPEDLARRWRDLHLHQRERPPRGRLPGAARAAAATARRRRCRARSSSCVRTTILKLLHSGWMDQVTINQAGHGHAGPLPARGRGAGVRRLGARQGPRPRPRPPAQAAGAAARPRVGVGRRRRQGERGAPRHRQGSAHAQPQPPRAGGAGHDAESPVGRQAEPRNAHRHARSLACRLAADTLSTLPRAGCCRCGDRMRRVAGRERRTRDTALGRGQRSANAGRCTRLGQRSGRAAGRRPAWLQPPPVLPRPSAGGPEGPPRPYGAEPPPGHSPPFTGPGFVQAQNHALLYGPFPAAG